MSYKDNYSKIEEVLNVIKNLESDLMLHKLDPTTGIMWWTPERKKHVLHLLIDFNRILLSLKDDPRNLRLIEEVKGLKRFLEKLKIAYNDKDIALNLKTWIKKNLTGEFIDVAGINLAIDRIIEHLKRWEKINKTTASEETEEEIDRIPIHKNSDYFWVNIKELNPLRIYVKHKTNPIQMERVKKLSNSDLMRFNPEDPISGSRFFDGTGRSIGRLEVKTGHHRVFEMYERYIHGKIKPDTMIEFLKA